METEKCIRERRSVRRYAEGRISEEDIAAILEAARWAPSGLNNQPWRVAVVEDRDKAEEIAACTKYSSIVAGAPLLLAVFLDREASYDRDKDLMAVGAFIQNALLTIHSRGLGAVWLGEILNQKDSVARILEVPGDMELVAVLAIGKPSGEPGAGSRRELEELIIRRL